MQSFEVASLVDSPNNSNVTDLLLERVQSTPNLPLFSLQTEKGWKDVSGADFLAQVENLAKGFIAAGIQPGQAVGIMSKTRYEWTLIDFAIWFAGAIPVPIYESSAPNQMEWILSDSDAVALIVENQELLSRFEEIKKKAPLVRQVWIIDSDDLQTVARLGKEISAETLQQRRTAAKLNDLATLIYTSGTTGRPKGCELTHRGFVDLCRNAVLELPEVVYAGATTLLFLPLAHVLARFISVLCIYGGIKVGHQPDTKNVMPSMLSFKPTFLLAVPRVFEKVYNTAEQKAESSGKGGIFRSAAHTAIAYSKALDTAAGPSLALRVKFKFFDLLVLSKLRAAMGGNVRYAVSGGAPLGSRLGHFYRALGLIVLEGYGLT
ncbi:MAG: AMP-binding protein, partial [Actinomycetes bacterium]